MGLKSAHGHADALPDDGRFPDTGIGNPQFTVFFLQAFQRLVNPADLSDILTENQRLREMLKDIIEIVAQDLPCRGPGADLSQVGCFDFLNLQRI